MIFRCPFTINSCRPQSISLIAAFSVSWCVLIGWPTMIWCSIPSPYWCSASRIRRRASGCALLSPLRLSAHSLSWRARVPANPAGRHTQTRNHDPRAAAGGCVPGTPRSGRGTPAAACRRNTWSCNCLHQWPISSASHLVVELVTEPDWSLSPWCRIWLHIYARRLAYVS